MLGLVSIFCWSVLLGMTLWIAPSRGQLVGDMFKISLKVNTMLYSFITTNFPNNLEHDASQFCMDLGYATNGTCYRAIVDYAGDIREGHFNFDIRYEDLDMVRLSAPSDSVMSSMLINSKLLVHGDSHYRTFHGNGNSYGTLGASEFALLYHAGMKEHHHLLDLHCGGMHLGRLAVPYLDRERYSCVEKNEWLAATGFRFELGADITALKRPRFSKTAQFSEETRFDYIIAHSVFGHGGTKYFKDYLSSLAQHMRGNTVLLASFKLSSGEDQSLSKMTVVLGRYGEEEWIFPDIVPYTEQYIARLVKESADLHVEKLEWMHPTHTWFVMAKSAQTVRLMKRRIPAGTVEPWQNVDRTVSVISCTIIYLYMHTDYLCSHGR
jgi:cyclopropane fatty-acyl-phospholipid synthase-like methyltransferase